MVERRLENAMTDHMEARERDGSRGGLVLKFPWQSRPLEHSVVFERELLKKIAPDSPLYGQPFHIVAARIDTHDVIFDFEDRWLALEPSWAVSPGRPPGV